MGYVINPGCCCGDCPCPDPPQTLFGTIVGHRICYNYPAGDGPYESDFTVSFQMNGLGTPWPPKCPTWEMSVSGYLQDDARCSPMHLHDPFCDFNFIFSLFCCSFGPMGGNCTANQSVSLHMANCGLISCQEPGFTCDPFNFVFDFIAANGGPFSCSANGAPGGECLYQFTEFIVTLTG